MAKKKAEQLPLPGMGAPDTSKEEFIDRGLSHALFLRGYWFNGFNAKYQGDGWFCIFKVISPTEGAKVAFIGGKTLKGGISDFTQQMYADAVDWRPDKFRAQSVDNKEN